MTDISKTPPVLQLVRTKTEPDADMIANMDRVIETIRGGEVTGLAVVFTFRDGSVGTVFNRTDEGSLFALMGGVDYLRSRIMNGVRE